ncbi:MAG: hypothetical protein JRN21_09810 [Nitrososphaerota archaeon]|nr:hypothetical protein [Nitrososphaerota archaeon]
MSLWRVASKYEPAIPLVTWLVDRCIEQADAKESKTWTYTKFVERENANRRQINETVETRRNDPLPMRDSHDLNMKFEYLNACHTVLDHRNWHLKVFNEPLAMTIECLAESLGDGHIISGRRVRDYKIDTAFPEFEQLVLQAGFTKDAHGRGKYNFTYEPPAYTKHD